MKKMMIMMMTIPLCLLYINMIIMEYNMCALENRKIEVELDVKFSLLIVLNPWV